MLLARDTLLTKLKGGAREMMTFDMAALTLGKPVSAVLQEYMEPLITEWHHAGGKSVDELNKLLETPWTIWNAVVYHDCYPDADRHNLLADMRSRIPAESVEILALLEFFIARKRQQFGEYRYLFRECTFRRARNGDLVCRAEVCLPSKKFDA
ncbi:MAG TPA: hypothetical protein VE954_27320 [Oligoflexus sp.]|uniref:hypothetical protein n=1 Tax=Oligoflexus sp. TaxID=1971216 RepID=UPI002D6C3D31|nr:hypothetical protein [Oligoflexus sp.]HYX36835.1 hypothetical protein [Oligoflexus sp.]